MSINGEIFEAMLQAFSEAGMSRTGLAIPGEAGTFVVMLSMAETLGSAGEDETDARLR